MANDNFPNDIISNQPERRSRRFEESPDFEDVDWETTAEIAKEIQKKTGSRFVYIQIGKRPKKH